MVCLGIIPWALVSRTYADIAPDAEQHGPEAEQRGGIDLSVSVDPTGQSGHAQAMVTIRAARSIVWSLLSSCANARKLVPGLVDCTVIETAPDHSWQLIRHVIAYSWYVPRVEITFLAEYRYPNRISMTRVSGDLRVFESSWDLEGEGESTIARYSLALAPSFWVPRWLVRTALRHDLPKMLRGLRSLAESSREGSS